MQKGRSFEKQIEKVIDYIEKLGFHGHKNYAKRTSEGLYLEGECFDYEIFLPNRHDCFDAKQCDTDTWHIVKKDFRQVNELKKCKNAGCNAYFLICFENKDVKMIDVDLVIEYLEQNKKSIKKYGFPSWDLIKEIKRKGVTMEQDIKILKNIKNIFLNLKYHGYINDIKKDISTDGVINAIENILEERQQDKDKIKELEEKWDKDTHKLQNALDMANADKINNYIPVSLIEEKLEKEKLPNIIVGGRRNAKTLEYGKKLGRIEMCEELLEKRK